jgi:cytoskeletal protein RodZ
MRRSTVLLCIVIGLIALWLMQTSFQPKESGSSSKVATAPKTRTSAPTPPKAEVLAVTRKPIRFTSKAGIRLKPDE